MTLLIRQPPPLFSHHSFPNSTLSPPLKRINSKRPTLYHAIKRNDDAADTFTENSGYLFKLSDSESESLSEYNVAKIASVYRKKPVILARRLLQIGTTLGRWFLLRYIDGVMERADSMFKVRASQLRKILVELGPAYVKIAQAISSRSDLIPPSYLEELALLQDQINPFSNEVAFSTIEQELGMPLDRLFSEISPEPVAAASLGQVYQARLRRDGELVAVKVQRPGVKAAISLDIYILRFIAGVIRRAGKFNTDLQAVVDEWASSLFREMDYRTEAQNGLKFRELYGGLPDVVVPQMYVEKTTQKVLTMEWVEGQKLAEVKDLYLVEVGVYCSFNQLLEHGFYHADPHPGNLLRTNDGRLAYLDFGMMGEFKEELRDGFMEACLHLVNRDFDALATDFITLGLLPPTAEKDAVTKALTGVFQNAVSKGVRNVSFGDLSDPFNRLAEGVMHAVISHCSLAVLEGIAISFDPDYKVLGSTYPWIARKVLIGSSPKLRSSLQSLLYEDGVFRIDRLESLFAESRRARIDKTLEKKEEFDAKLAAKEILSFTLTDKGSFVREIFLEETNKGLDALSLATLNSFPFPVPLLSSTMSNEDIINLRNLLQVVQSVSGQDPGTEPEKISKYDNWRSDLIEISLVLNRLPSTREFQPILAAVNELPLEQQLRCLRLPADVLSKLLSRMAARTVRRYFM